MNRRFSLLFGATALALSACTAGPSNVLGPDGPDDDALSAGKADGTDFSECEKTQIVSWLNDAETNLEALRGAGVHANAARDVLRHRDGADATFGTGDDDLFDDIEEVDAVRNVGAVALRQMAAAIALRCEDPPVTSGDETIEVVFSPTNYENSHMARLAQEIDAATKSIDIAIYSYSDAAVSRALERAIDRGVRVRVINETGRKDCVAAPAMGSCAAKPTSVSGRFEAMGADVRFVNQIMHHKFGIIDGVQVEGDDASTATLVTGSGNWNNGAATQLNENTLFMQDVPELALRFQQEFNTLWAGSKDIVGEGAPHAEATLEITDEMIAAADAPALDARFTSSNFFIREDARNGASFRLNTEEADLNHVSNRIVELIESANESIHVASGHLRSRPIAEALIARHKARPDIDIRIYLDGQEFISRSAHDSQVADREECLGEADTDSERRDCNDRGFLWAYQAHSDGVPVRFKYYAYRWDHSYAPQMHHKFLLVDHRWLASGSYNFSDNAEHGTMENMLILDGGELPELVQSFENEFEAMWRTGEAEGLYATLLADIPDGNFPIVFAPMALDWTQVSELKTAMTGACSQINSADFRSNPGAHRRCGR